MNTYSITFPLVVAVVMISLAVLPGMLADEAVELVPDDQVSNHSHPVLVAIEISRNRGGGGGASPPDRGCVG